MTLSNNLDDVKNIEYTSKYNEGLSMVGAQNGVVHPDYHQSMPNLQPNFNYSYDDEYNEDDMLGKSIHYFLNY